jgi:molecular chaperone GrpE (heat shock protein)
MDLSKDSDALKGPTSGVPSDETRESKPVAAPSGYLAKRWAWLKSIGARGAPKSATASSVGSSSSATATQIVRATADQQLARLISEKSQIKARLEDLEETTRRERRAFYLKVIEVLDSIDRLLQQINPNNEATNSLGAVRTQFLLILEDNGITLADVRVGQTFDAAFCEVSRRETRADLPPDTIVSIERRGYLWNSKTLRRARVVISAQ